MNEYYLPAGTGRLFVREVGGGPPLVVLHGGPALDHAYLVPELDALATAFRVVYYAHRGRGASFSGEGPDDVSMAGEIADIDLIRQHLRAEEVALLGHSWGGLLAMAYALEKSRNVSHLILLSPGPASRNGFEALRREWRDRRTPEQTAEMTRLAEDPAYLAGALAADSAYDRIHFASTVRDKSQLDDLVGRMRANQTPRSLLAARLMGERLIAETWGREGFDLTPRLRELRVPTLVITGDNDFIPMAVMREISEAVPGARLEVLDGAGHFAYMERLESLVDLVVAFVGR